MALGNQLNLPWWRSKYILWAFLMLPGLLFTIGVLIDNMTYESYMHSSLSTNFPNGSIGIEGTLD